jgi:zinc D-Ala-D-Ala carboxypeptidase
VKRKYVLILAAALSVIALCALGAVWFLRYHTAAPSTSAQLQHTTTKEPEPIDTTPTFDKQQYSLTDPTSPWVVVNKQHPLTPLNYAPTDLMPIGNNQQMRAEAAAALARMFADAQTAGFALVADSGYRSFDTQTSTYNSIVRSQGQAYADTVSAHPGFSEHQAGWAVDIGTGNCHVEDCFGDTAGGKWTAENAYKYGFIMRYPQSLSDITGYSNEAWHFRYVGTALSTQLHIENIQTLEQFFDVTGGKTYKT